MWTMAPRRSGKVKVGHAVRNRGRGRAVFGAVTTALLTIGSLSACGEDSGGSASDATDSTVATDAVTDTSDATDAAAEDTSDAATSDVSVEGALAELLPKVEEREYDCDQLPAEDFNGVASLFCMPDDLTGDRPMLALYNRSDVSTGKEVVEAQLEHELEGFSGGQENRDVRRETLAEEYLALDGDDITGLCFATSQDCEGTAGELGLEVSQLYDEQADY